MKEPGEESDEVFDELDDFEYPDHLSFSVTKEPLFNDGFDYESYGRCGTFLRNGERCGSAPIAWVLKRVMRRVGQQDKWFRIPMYACQAHYKDKDRTNDTYLLKTSTDYAKGESSPYWNTVERKGERNDEGEAMEFVKNNPDILGEDKTPWANVSLPEELRELADRAKTAANTFTPKQKEVFDLLVYERRNQYEIAAILRIDREAVRKRIEGIIKKLSSLDTTQNGDLAINNEGRDTNDRNF